MSSTADEPGWRIVAERGLRDLWSGGRALILLIAFAAFMTVFTILMATSPEINLFTQLDMIFLTVEVVVVVGVLLVLVLCADAFSGERDRSTLECLILTPVPRSHIALGKFIAALSIWVGVLLVSIPYLALPTKGTGLLGTSVLLIAVVGTVLVFIFSFLGLLISAFSKSNVASFGISLFAFFALVAPTQLPGDLRQSTMGDLLIRGDPASAGMNYMSSILVDGGSWTSELSYMASPLVLALAVTLLSLFVIDRYLRLSGGGPE